MHMRMHHNPSTVYKVNTLHPLSFSVVTLPYYDLAPLACKNCYTTSIACMQMVM